MNNNTDFIRHLKNQVEAGLACSDYQSALIKKLQAQVIEVQYQAFRAGFGCGHANKYNFDSSNLNKDMLRDYNEYLRELVKKEPRKAQEEGITPMLTNIIEFGKVEK